MTAIQLDRRTFLASTVAALVGAWRTNAQPVTQSVITRPMVSEAACPLEIIAPTAADGHRGLAVLRKPPGPGPFPVAVWFHGGITTVPMERLEATARELATPSRFLAAGYAFVAPTYRSRDVDLQNPETLQDALAVIDYLRRQPYVDRGSIVACGCSGGGDLALQLAAETDVCAVVAEEPASPVMTGVFNNSTPKKGERFTPEDSMFLLQDGRRHYTPELQRAFRAKVARIKCPILIVQGNVDRRELPINRFNADVLIPELRAMGKDPQISQHSEQAHCFCSSSGQPRRGGAAAPASWPAAALKAFQDIDTFCRRQVRTAPRPIEAALVTYEPVRQGPIAP